MYGKLMFDKLDDALDCINKNRIKLMNTKIVPCPCHDVIGVDVQYALILEENVIDRIKKNEL